MKLQKEFKKINGKFAYPESVEEAALVFDQEFPGWHEKVNLKKFDMGCARSCVFWYVTGTFSKRWDYFEKDANNFKIFSSHTADWRTEITERLDVKTALNTTITVEYTDGFRENVKSTLDIPVGIKYKVVLN